MQIIVYKKILIKGQQGSHTSNYLKKPWEKDILNSRGKTVKHHYYVAQLSREVYI